MATSPLGSPLENKNSSVFWAKLTNFISSNKTIAWFEIINLILLFSFAALTIFFFSSQSETAEPLSPPTAATILVVNLLPASFLIALLGRRLALKRASPQDTESKGKLHVRLVAIFSLTTTIPILLLVIFASLLFQNGVQFWFSDPARNILENAGSLAKGYYQEKLRDVGDETVTMASDIRFSLSQTNADNPEFLDAYLTQVLRRKLSESAIISIDEKGVQRTTAVVASDNQEREEWITSSMLGKLKSGEGLVVEAKADRIEATTLLFENPRLYLYTARAGTVPSFVLGGQAQEILNDYDDMIVRSRNLQVQFNVALYIVSLSIIGIAVWVALIVADRLVQPVNQLVIAAQKVADGDLSARVSPHANQPDEIGILSNSFNDMTERLELQNNNLLFANNQLDSRRAFIETVLETVSAGIVSLNEESQIILANSNAAKQLSPDGTSLIGRNLRELSPDLAKLMDDEASESVIQIGDGPEPQTLAVNMIRGTSGVVITFEDISQQLADQKRAAWSDVARRIAHEIKNPLTPIQLAAERLKRRFSSHIEEGNDVFDQLTDTIVRQVSDLRKIADEFSSFARMPKPILREENIADIVRHSVFLHEVSNAHINFSVTVDDEKAQFICDRRQIGQAITNIVKNATEAVQERADSEDQDDFIGEIDVTIMGSEGNLSISITDNGTGLPDAKDRIAEPYVTTRSSGSGLGLAIVKKIVEEHFGKMSFEDIADGGAKIILSFDMMKLTSFADGETHKDSIAENG